MATRQEIPLSAVGEWSVVSRHTLAGRICSVSFSSEGRLLASGSCSFQADEGFTDAVILWDLSSGEECSRLNCSRLVTWVSFSRDSNLLAWGANDKSLHIWDRLSGREPACLERDRGYECSTFSPDCKLLASAGYYDQITLWEVSTGREVKNLESGDRGTYSKVIAFSPDGHLLVSGSNLIFPKDQDHSSSLILWDLSSGMEVRRLKGHKHWIRSVSFSPDGSLLATSSLDGTVRVWNVASGRELKCLGGLEVHCVSFSPDGKILAAGATDNTLRNTVRFWEVSSGKEIECHNVEQAMYSVSFSPDGQLLASGALKGTILVWKLDLSVNKMLRYFKDIGRVDANLLGQLVQECRANGKLRDLAASLQAHGFYEEAARIYDDLGQVPKKPKSESAQRPKESKPTSREAAPTKSVCPSCDSEVKANWLECPECGASLKETACQNCGEPLEPHWKRCPVCRVAV